MSNVLLSFISLRTLIPPRLHPPAHLPLFRLYDHVYISLLYGVLGHMSCHLPAKVLLLRYTTQIFV